MQTINLTPLPFLPFFLPRVYFENCFHPSILCYFIIFDVLFCCFAQDQQLRFLSNQVNQADYLETLQNVPSPLNHSMVLGDIV